MSSIYTCNICSQGSELKNHYGRNRWDPEDSCIFNHFQCLSQKPELDVESLPVGALTDCSARNCLGFTDGKHRDHAVLIDPKVKWGQKCLLSKYCGDTVLEHVEKESIGAFEKASPVDCSSDEGQPAADTLKSSDVPNTSCVAVGA